MSARSHSPSDDDGPARKKLKTEAPFVPSRMGSTILIESQDTTISESQNTDSQYSTYAATAESSPAKSTPKAARGRLAKSATTSDAVEKKTPGRAVRGRKSAASVVEADDDDVVETAPKKRGARKKAEVPDVPTPDRVSTAWKVGAHVSMAGGIQNAISNAAKIGANAFALFLKSQRKWVSPAYKPADIEAFRAAMQKQGYDPKHVLPHGSYLINLANPDEAKWTQSYTCFVDDLKRAETLGLLLYNFHPGSTIGQCTREEGIAKIASSLNSAHKETTRVVTVLENMAGQGNVIGSKFEDLRDIIALVEDKTRVGVCLDTCHMFAAGYDIRTKEAYEATMANFETIVGTQYLRGIHLNDSKFDLASKKDRHENLGVGKIGLRSFSYIVADARMRDIPLVLETPCDDDTGVEGVWAVEIAALNQLALDAQAGEATMEVDVTTLSIAADVEKSSATTVESSSAVVTTVAVATSTKSAEVDEKRLGELLDDIRVASAKSNAKKAAPKKSAPKGTKRKKKGDDSDEDDDDDHDH